MKRLITTILIGIAFTITAQKTAYSDFYKANKEESQFSMSVPVSLGSFFSDEEDSEEFEELMKKAEHCKIVIFNNENNKTEQNFKKFTKRKGLKTLVKVRDGKDKAGVFFIEKGDLVKEIIIRANSDEEKMVMIGLKITLTKDELASVVTKIKAK